MVVFGVVLHPMNSLLPPTGTTAFLQELSPYIPDEFINQLLPARAGRGRPHAFSPAQLWRLHLLPLLTPTHSFNLLLQMLPEQRDWRRFAHLPNRHALPGVRLVHEFRQRLGVAGLRRINEQLLAPLLPRDHTGAWAVALIDATDLPAAAAGFKKNGRGNTRRSAPRSGRAPSRPVRAGSFWATRNTPCGCGCGRTNAACCWCRSSVGSRRPTRRRGACWCRACGIAGSGGSGDRM